MSGFTSKSMACVAFKAPLQMIETPIPALTGTQVIVRNTYAGVCHSDLHISEGAIGGFPLKESALPFVVGHEMEGEVVAVGPDVADKTIVGRRFAVYPWLGCGENDTCVHCSAGTTNHCENNVQKFCDGKSMFAGYSSHVVVPDPKYLVDASGTGLPDGLAAVYMCSGLTAFAALKKLGTPPRGAKDVLILGLGGLGQQGVGLAQAMFGGNCLAADIKPEALALAAASGATVFNSRDEGAIEAIKATAGGRGVYGVIDFVGSKQTHAFARSCVRKSGTVVAVGLFGGQMEGMHANLPYMIVTSTSVCGTLTGSLGEVHEMFDLLRKQKVPVPKHQFTSILNANQALQDMNDGKVTGRTILKHDWPESKM